MYYTVIEVIEMPRGKKRCNVKHYPTTGVFTPGHNSADEVVLTIDEVEAIRLVDFEEMSQVDSVASLGVSRGTVQRLLYSGRKKLADALINGKHIVIDTHKEFSDTTKVEGGSRLMTIAFVMNNEEVGGHFGRTNNLKILQLDSDFNTVNSMELNPRVSGGRARAHMLYEMNVKTVFSTEIGEKAKAHLESAGIEVFNGTDLSIDACISKLKEGTAEPLEAKKKDHNHDCNGHGHDGNHQHHGKECSGNHGHQHHHGKECCGKHKH
jgi:predicted DNA-binding protein (UPF0251 family)/predicted Fe-Mo cluster-binding NifX family protein